jgi:hypothetical protein
MADNIITILDNQPLTIDNLSIGRLFRFTAGSALYIRTKDGVCSLATGVHTNRSEVLNSSIETVQKACIESH